MKEMNKLDNISNMSDEELDEFIKSELNSSLMEDIKVDEELINKTMKAANFADVQVNSEIHSNEISFDNKKSSFKLKRYIPILSMAACTCLIVMAGSLVYSQIGKNKSEDASLSKDESYSKVEDMSESDQELHEDSYLEDEKTANIITNNQLGNSEDQGELDGSLPETNCPEADKDSMNDMQEEPQESNKDVIYKFSKFLNIRDDNGEFIEMSEIESGDISITMYDEDSIEYGQEEALEYIDIIYEEVVNDSVKVLTKEFDSEELSGREYVYIQTNLTQYYIALITEESINNEIKIVVFEKH